MCNLTTDMDADIADLQAEVDALKDAVAAYEADAVAYRAEVERLKRIEELALIWSAYQTDESKREQAEDVGKRILADMAEDSLYSAVAETTPSPGPVYELACADCGAIGQMPLVGRETVSLERVQGWSMVEGVWRCPKCHVPKSLTAQENDDGR